MITFKRTTALFFVALLCPAILHAQDAKKDVLQVVNSFFAAMEKNDSTALKKLFVETAYYHSVRESADSVIISGRPIAKGNFASRSINERFKDKGVEVLVHKSIATVWGPYTLSINNVFSHCGVDVFTLFKTKNGWKIASLNFSADKACD